MNNKECIHNVDGMEIQVVEKVSKLTVTESMKKEAVDNFMDSSDMALKMIKPNQTELHQLEVVEVLENIKINKKGEYEKIKTNKPCRIEREYGYPKNKSLNRKK